VHLAPVVNVTPLMLALLSGQQLVANYLIKKGDITIKDGNVGLSSLAVGKFCRTHCSLLVFVDLELLSVCLLASFPQSSSYSDVLIHWVASLPAGRPGKERRPLGLGAGPDAQCRECR